MGNRNKRFSSAMQMENDLGIDRKLTLHHTSSPVCIYNISNVERGDLIGCVHMCVCLCVCL